MAPSSKNTPLQGRPREKRSRSRVASPPATTTTSSGFTPYLHTAQSSLLVPPNLSIDALMDKHTPNSASPPSASSLHALHDSIHSLVLSNVRSRSDVCDRSMRELSRKKKLRADQQLDRERQQQEAEQRKRARVSKKNDAPRPPAVGAHGLARQDGGQPHEGMFIQSFHPLDSLTDTLLSETSPTDSPSAQVTAAKSEHDNDSSSPSPSDTEHQPAPAPTIAHYETFGSDPTQFDDPTIYHIRDWTPDMSEEEKRAIFSVARFPHDDLHDLTPGTPPDMDFSIAKPATQINFSTFQAYVEPYIRPLTEEDVAFLKERGDRVTPYLVPPRGPMPYTEVWAKEDGVSHHDFNLRLASNEPRGNIEDMNDDVAETAQISAGPLISRLLSSFRHDPHVVKDDQSSGNGDVSMTNGESTAGGGQENEQNTNNEEQSDALASVKPATYFPDQHKIPPNSGRDLGPLEQRTLQELRYCGFITPEASPDYDSQYDDEVAARLRYLQSELQRVAQENSCRKARVLELTEERMAMQEYSTIADDLDSQINQAYLKRNRTMSKPKKGAGKGRPGGTGGVAMSRNLVSEGVKMLMDRRKEWRDLIGPVVDFGQQRIPKETVFDKENMERLEKIQADAGDEEIE
jgi:transcriptional adapter 3